MQDNTVFGSPSTEVRIDGRRFIELLRRRPMLISVATLLAPIAAFLYLSRQAPTYQAVSTLVIDQATPQYLGSNFRDVVDVENAWWNSQEYLATQQRIMLSRNTAVATAHDLCIAKFPNQRLPDGTTVIAYLTGDPSCAPSVVQRAGKMILDRLEVAPVKESRVVSVTIRDSKPDVARIIANGVAETYARLNLERRLATSEGATDWLGTEFKDLTQELKDAEEALVNFKRKNNLVTVQLDDQQNELTQRRHKIVDELSSVQLKLINLNSQREEYKSLRDNDPQSDTSPAIQDNPVIQKMKESYALEYVKLKELQSKYKDKMPAVVAEEERMARIKIDISNEAKLTVRALDLTYAAKQKEEKDLQAELNRTTAMALQLEAKATQYNGLKRTFERLQKLSEQVGGREKESSVAAHLKTNNIYILDPAQTPDIAIKPNPLIVCALAMVVGFMLGFGLAFILDMLDASIKTPEDIEERLRLPYLGVIPRIQPSDKELVKGPIELYIHSKPKSPIAERCRAIRTSLMFMSPDKPLRRILVTSGEPQEGKSTTAVNLAITMAQSGQRVLLVDTDMRRPRIHKIFKLATTAGFSSLVAGESKDIDGLVRATEVPNLFVMPCGPIPPNPAELLHSDRCRVVVKDLGDRFDRVIFDSPPLGLLTDAAILSSLCDGVVLVAKSGKTSRELLGRARKLLTDLKANILGVVINDLDLLNRAYGYRYYHYRYGQYYGEGESSSTPSKPASSASS